MKIFASLLATLILLGTAALSTPAAAPPPPRQPGQVGKDGKMPLTKLEPAKLFTNLCKLRYPVSTSSEKCQAFCDQGLGWYYSYVWMEAARSFETALAHDPDCPMAWVGLSRALQRWHRGDSIAALKMAWKLRDHASDKEKMLITARMQMKGLLPNVGNLEVRKKKAIGTIDDLLAIYEDDEEAWYYRAQLAGGQGLFGGESSSVPFYKALLRINPIHPGANHELVHFYEKFRRPALGTPHADRYIESSPGIPHAFHMQAHLATRLGHWHKTSDRSSRAIQLQQAYHKLQNVKPNQDWQYSHHLETLLVSLTHDGRFKEARAIKKECERCNYHLNEPFIRLALAERDYATAVTLIGKLRRNKATASYYKALLYLKKGEPTRALPEIQVLQNVYRGKRNDRRLELRLWEVQGLYQCATGSTASGLKLLEKAVTKTKDDFNHHAWGNGAYYMEAWGIGALLAGKMDVAEEAFHEALAHDPGSVRAALGMQVVCERQNRTDEIERFAALAARCWKKADSGHRETELAALRGEKKAPVDPTKKAISKPAKP